MPLSHLMPQLPVFDRIKQNGKIIILRVQLLGLDMQFQPFMVNPDFLSGICTRSTPFSLAG